MLEIRNVSVKIGHLKILKDVSLFVDKGEVVSLIGANGAGKTTLIKTIARLNKHSEGSILFLGKNLNDCAPSEVARLGITLVPEGRGVFPYMTVLENLEMGVYMLERKEREKINERLDLVFKMFPVLKERKDQLAGTLSGGEQQMLSLARAFISAPKLIIADELSLGLAQIVVNVLYKFIHEMNLKGVSFLLVEQNLRRALKFSNRAYVMEKGRIVWEGVSDQADEEELRRKYFGLS